MSGFRRIVGFGASLALLVTMLAVGPRVAEGSSVDTSDVSQPVVAVHVSEYTSALESMPALGATPNGLDTTHMQWWLTSWRYFVAYQSLETALRADGTPYVEVTDADIAAGHLLTASGRAKFPIVVSLAAEAIADDEVAPLNAYVNAGGFLFVGSSSFTRHPDGTSRGNFGLADLMGLHMTTPTLQDWVLNYNLTKVGDSRLTRDLPAGTVDWNGKASFDTTAWGNTGSWAWQATADDAQVLATTSFGTVMLATKQAGVGSGRVIYDAQLQPLLGDTGYSSSAFAYAIYRRAIEWAFESAGMPIIKLSPWQYPYDAAGVVRHDYENYFGAVAAIPSAAAFEASVGMKGDYYFTTGILRLGSEYPVSDQEKAAAIDGIRYAASHYGTTIGSHNGGLPNPAGSPTDPAAYDYFHWGPDQALDMTSFPPADPPYTSGYDYAKRSLAQSFADIEGWMGTSWINPFDPTAPTGAVDNGRTGCGESLSCPRTFVSPYFNEGREGSHQILNDLGVQWAGEQKVGPFPIQDFSYLQPNTQFSMTGMGVDNWYVGNSMQQSIDGYIGSQDMVNAVDWYYELGALINLYGHGDLHAYVQYVSSLSNLWKTNAVGVRDWEMVRQPVQVTPSYTTQGATSVATATISGATDPQTAIELVIPNWSQAAPSALAVKLNGTAAPASTWRITKDGVKIQVGNAVGDVEVDYTPVQTWNQTTWSGGFGQGQWSDATKYQSAGNIDTTVAGQIGLTSSSGGDVLFADDFTRLPVPPSASFGWTIPNTSASGDVNELSGSLADGILTTTATSGTYGFAYPSNSAPTIADGAVQAAVSSAGYGGGISGRLNVATGARYTLWLFGDGTLKLIKFYDWGRWNNGTDGLAKSFVANASGWHTLKLTFSGNTISGYVDGSTTPAVTAIDNGTDGVPAYTAGTAGIDLYAAGNTIGPRYNDFVVTDDVGTQLFADDFGSDQASDGNLVPWQQVNGSWTITDGVLQGIGGYGNAKYEGMSANDYTVDARISFSPGSYGGGVGVRLDAGTGAHYGIWLYPQGTSDLSANAVKLIKFTGWTTWGGVPLQVGRTAVSSGGWHDLKVEAVGARIRAWLDGAAVIDFTETNSPLIGSGITLDTYTPGTMNVDNVVVHTPTTYQAAGSLVSSGFDAGAGSTWQGISWDSSAPTGTIVAMRTRTSDSFDGLATSAWSDPYSSSHSTVADAGHRWMQYEVDLTATNPALTPYLYDVTATYTTGVPTNSPPVATAQSLSTAEDTTTPVTLVASDADGDVLTYTAVTEPAHGILSGTAPNLTYTPTIDYHGADSFVFTASDGSATGLPAAVSITVTAVNDTTVCVDGARSTLEDTVLASTVTCSDADDTALSYTFSDPVHGVVVAGLDGTFTYTPTPNYNGADSFTFTATDGTATSNTATMSITVTAVNDTPVVTNPGAQHSVEGATDINVQIAATDIDNDPLAYTASGLPTGLTISPTTGVITGATGTTGAYTVTVIVSDGTLTATTEFNWTINNSNRTPVAASQTVTGDEDVAIAVTLSATDADNDTLAYTITTPPAHGALSGTAPNLTYTPAADYHGPDTFLFAANDSTIDSNNAVVSITITAVNDTPSITNPGTQTDLEGETASLQIAASDADDDSLSYTASGLPVGLTINSNTGLITGSTGYSAAGSYTVTARVSDGVVTASTTFAWTISNTNHAPVATDTSLTGIQDNWTAISLTATDADNDTLTYALTTQPAHGTLAGTAPNLTFMPSFGYSGSDSFTFTASDGSVISNTATVAITVAAVASKPPPTPVMPHANYVPLAPVRVLESRVGQASTFDGQFWQIGPRPAGSVTELTIAGRGDIPADATAVVLNVTVTEPAGTGYITVFPCGSPTPNTSNLNYLTADTVANTVIAKIGTNGKICLYTPTTTHLIVDLNGYYPAGSTYDPTVPVRVLESRVGQASTFDGQFWQIGPRPAGSVTELTIAGRGDIPADATAVVLNVTVTEPAGTGYITVFPCGSPTPNTSNLNYLTADTVANTVIAKIGTNGKICLYTPTTTHLIVDLNGYYP
ncbi:MAG: Ig-like domain-containing protein [Ilumatobacteraceae bacterium]